LHNAINSFYNLDCNYWDLIILSSDQGLGSGTHPLTCIVWWNVNIGPFTFCDPSAFPLPKSNFDSVDHLTLQASYKKVLHFSLKKYAPGGHPLRSQKMWDPMLT